MRCADAALTEKMIARILEAKRDGDTCGGTFEVVAIWVPIGLGSFSQWDRRLELTFRHGDDEYTIRQRDGNWSGFCFRSQ